MASPPVGTTRGSGSPDIIATLVHEAFALSFRLALVNNARSSYYRPRLKPRLQKSDRSRASTRQRDRQQQARKEEQQTSRQTSRREGTRVNLRVVQSSSSFIPCFIHQRATAVLLLLPASSIPSFHRLSRRDSRKDWYLTLTSCTFKPISSLASLRRAISTFRSFRLHHDCCGQARASKPAEAGKLSI